jgi:methyltransferase (TIGR00027 family)
MIEGEPSRTAFSAAAHRAVHRLIDRPVLLDDPNAVAILGPQGAALNDPRGLAEHAAARAPMRALIVARSLFAEETLAKAVARGVDQYVLLGAGLDSFAYRNPWPSLRVFEVDYPATGRWKQAQLAEAGITIPANVAYAGLDFERETLAAGLVRAGFDLGRRAVFAWLGVAPYLTREAIRATLGAVAALAPGTEIVCDYAEPARNRSPEEQARLKLYMDAVAAAGEPWLSFFAPEEMARELHAAGFSEVEDLNGAAINARWFAGRDDGLRTGHTAHLVRARV